MNQPWQNRIVGHEDVDPMTLKGHAKNIRTHASAQRRLLEAALDDLGHVGKIVVSARTRRVLNGHLRVELAIGRDEPTIPVTWINVDEDEELVVLAFFDQIGEGAEIDAAKLKATFSQVQAGSEGLQTMLADWAASYQVTIVPAKPTLIAPPPAPALLVSAPAPVAVAVAPIAAAPIAVAPDSFPAGEAVVLINHAWPEHAPVATLPEAAALPQRGEALPEAPTGLVLDDMTFAAEERPFADMFASALIADHQVVRFAENAATSAAIAEVAKPKAEKPAPTTAVITIGEYTQNVNLARFTPWWGVLVASCDNDGVRLAAEIKARLGFGA